MLSFQPDTVSFPEKYPASGILAVRDLPGIEALGFQVFAGSIAVSHAYAHVMEFGDPVEIGGLRSCSGDLLHDDLHKVHMIPIGAARELPGIAEQVLRDGRELFELIERKDFSVDMLSAKLEERVKSRLSCE